MGMRDTIRVLNEMVSDGVITRYAIGGAVAAYNYIEAASTDDLDVLVSFDGFETSSASGLVTLGPIIDYLASKGYDEWQKEGIVVEGWRMGRRLLKPAFYRPNMSWRQLWRREGLRTWFGWASSLKPKFSTMSAYAK
jgi:hypothetical protein